MVSENDYQVQITMLEKELADLKQLFRRYRRCIFKPYNPQDIGTKEFYDLDEQVEQAIKEE